MTVIQISDEQAATLQANAAAQGLTLDAWLRKLAGVEELPGRKRRYHLSELVAQCDLTAQVSAEDNLWIDAPSVGHEA